MLKKILVVDDDEMFRETLCIGLEGEYIVLQAAEASEAKEIITNSDVDLIITDVHLPGDSGFELLEWVQKQKPIPLVLMTGYFTLLEGHEKANVSKNIIMKPFKMTQLKSIIELNLKHTLKDVRKANAPGFCKVSIDELLKFQNLDFDLYLKLSESNFVKVANKVKELPMLQISKYKQKGVRFLYLKREDFSQLVQFNLEFSKLVKESARITLTQKMVFLDKLSEIVLEEVYADGLDEDSFEAVSTFVQMAVATISESAEIYSLLDILQNTSSKVYNHSLATAIYAVLIARELKFDAPVTNFKLCLAAVFQDIGKKEIQREILQKNQATLPREERKYLESHVVRGQEILSSIIGIPQEVIRLVQEHHEDISGTGYPVGKKRFEQHPLSRILQAANLFVDQVVIMQEAKKQIIAAHVIDRIEADYDGRVDLECTKALRNMFKVSIAESALS